MTSYRSQSRVSKSGHVFGKLLPPLVMTRLKASKSAHRWRTGHSSSSNPKIYKFRNQAKCRELGGHVSSAKSSSALTAEALARHDDGLESDITMTKEDDQFTMEGKKSARSAWTLETEFAGGTYNGTAFHCVQRLWNSSLASHRQVTFEFYISICSTTYLSIHTYSTRVLTAVGTLKTKTRQQKIHGHYCLKLIYIATSWHCRTII